MPYGKLQADSVQSSTPKTVTVDSIVTTGDTGTVTSTMLANGTIVNEDVNASAAIAGTKISPDFGAQNVTTTGTSTSASFIPSSATVPTNGVYLPAANSVAISTNGSGRLFVDASGNVGVGASPVVTFAGQTHLTVNHSAGGITIAGINLATDGTRRASLITYPGNSEALRITAESATLPITFHTNSSERMRLDSSGRLGIGTSSPGAVLEAAGGGSTTVFKAYSTTAGIGGVITSLNNTSENYYDADKHTFRLGNGGGPIATFTSSGRVGIGSAAPSGILHTKAATNQFIGEDSATGNIFAIQNTGGATTLNSYLSTNGRAPIVFTQYTSECGRWDSSGKLLVGTSSSSASAAAVLQGFAGSSTSQGILQLQVGKTTAATAVNENLGSVRFANSDGNIGAWISGEADLQWNSGDYPSRLVFSTTADGASSPTERLRITSTGQVRLAGAGITFNGDTATANELDDYEEGTWTPDVKAGGATLQSAWATGPEGRYTKVGNMVTVWMWARFNGITAATGAITITGLPFSAASITSIGLVEKYYLATAKVIGGELFGTTISLYDQSSATNPAPVITESDLYSFAGLSLNFSYRV